MTLPTAVDAYRHAQRLRRRPNRIEIGVVEVAPADVGRKLAGDRAQLRNRPLQLRLSSDIGQVRVDVGIGDADVNDPSHSSLFSCVKHDLGIGYGLVMGEEAVVESDPVGVDERVHPA